MGTAKIQSHEGWEFKIIGSTMGQFNKQTKLEELCRREAEAGWDLVEVFDSRRARFRRRVEEREKDSKRSGDPYANSFGMGEGKLTLIIFGGIAVLLTAVILILR